MLERKQLTVPEGWRSLVGTVIWLAAYVVATGTSAMSNASDRGDDEQPESGEQHQPHCDPLAHGGATTVNFSQAYWSEGFLSWTCIQVARRCFSATSGRDCS